MLRVHEVLRLDVMRDVQPISRHGLDRVIRWVHTWPEVLPWPHGGELLLTTGYSWPADAAEQRRILADLDRAGASAILFRADPPFFPSIPSPIRQAASAGEVGLAVLEAHHETSFAELVETINREIIRRQFEVLERSERIHRTLTAAALDAEAVESIADRLGELIGKRVVVTDRRLRALTATPAEWETIERAARGAISASGSSAHREGSFRTDQIEGIFFPVRTGREVSGYLIVVGPPGGMNELDVRAGEHGAVVAGLHLLRQQAVADAEARVRNTFVEAVLQGRLTGDSGLRERAQLLGFDPEGTYAVAIAAPVDADGTVRPRALTSTDDFQNRARLGQALQAALEAFRLPAFLAFALNQVQCLISADLPQDRLRRRVQGIWLHLRDAAPEVPVALVVGRPQQGHTGIPLSLRQAEAALGTVRGSGVWWYEDFETVRILGSASDREAMESLYRATLGALRDHSAALYETAVALITCGFNQRSAARRLDVHWNTLRHRVERMEEILGAGLDDPQTRFRLQMALEIEKLSGRPTGAQHGPRHSPPGAGEPV
ncbi:MAG: PucR family transcriptional regulator ligand-binding domain-containing protein [Armatimonadota bacterium]|nr:PucR family transcriptional regulator ligand-binding domain-containing protein [Armatimonadota bacterium]MDR5697775.1 PucR family transcriptional regulator ligand-binding domain-containing protein [Armatimonadota bacterium]